MKGLIFSELLEMVEDKFGFVVVDELVTSSNLPSGGTYTAVGTYEYTELVELLVNLNRIVKIEIPDLVLTFGEHLFSRFAVLYSEFFHDKNNSLDFLEDLESYIHVQVLKLYPDAQLPKFDIKRVKDNQLEMIYHSNRRLAHLAIGLITGCGKHFNEKLDIKTENLTDDASKVKFTITKLD